MSALRRYEILLPLRLNDGSPVPEALLVGAFQRVRNHFGAASWESQTIRGEWEHGGRVYQDDLVRIFVDVPDRAEDKEFFRTLKEQLKHEFQQLDIWITSSVVDVI